MKNKLIVLSTVMLVLVLVACNSVQPTTSNQPRQTSLGVQPQATTSGALAAPQSTNNAGESMSGPVPTDDANMQLDSPAVAEAKISAGLAKAMLKSPDDVEFLVTLTSQFRITAPLDSMSKNEANAASTKGAKDIAALTQPAVKAQLDALVKSGNVARYKAFWIVNGFFVKGTATAVNMIAARKDVARVEWNKKMHLGPAKSGFGTVGPSSSPTPASNSSTDTGTNSITDPQWNLSLINVPRAWQAG